MAKQQEKNLDFFKALEDWKDFAENLDENLDKLDLEEAMASVKKKSNKPANSSNASKITEVKKQIPSDNGDEKLFQEANDNADIDGMLENIMEALRHEGQLVPKPKESKKVYEPLERVKNIDFKPKSRQVNANPTDLLKPQGAFSDLSLDLKSDNKSKEEAPLTGMSGAPSTLQTAGKNVVSPSSFLKPGMKIGGPESGDLSGTVNTNSATGFKKLIDGKAFVFGENDVKDSLGKNKNTDKKMMIQNLDNTSEEPQNILGGTEGDESVRHDTDETPIISSKKKRERRKVRENSDWIQADVNETPVQEEEEENQEYKEIMGRKSPPRPEDLKQMFEQVYKNVTLEEAFGNNLHKIYNIMKAYKGNLDEWQILQVILTKFPPMPKNPKKKAVKKKPFLGYIPGKREGNEHENDDDENNKDPSRINGIATTEGLTTETNEGSKPIILNLETSGMVSIGNPLSPHLGIDLATLGTPDTHDFHKIGGTESPIPQGADDDKFENPFEGMSEADKLKFKMTNDMTDLHKELGIHKDGVINYPTPKSNHPLIRVEDNSPMPDSSKKLLSPDAGVFFNSKKAGKQNGVSNIKGSSIVPLDFKKGLHEEANIKVLPELEITDQKDELFENNRSRSRFEDSNGRIITSGRQNKNGSLQVFPEEFFKKESLDELEERWEWIELDRTKYQDEEKIDLTFSFDVTRLVIEEVDESQQYLKGNYSHNISLERRPTMTDEDAEEVDAPVPNCLIRFFLWLRVQASKLEAWYKKIRSPEYTLDVFFERNCVFWKGKIKITKNFFFIFMIMTIIMMVYAIDTSSAMYLSRVKAQAIKNYVSHLLPLAAVLFTYYGIGFLYIKEKWVKWVMLAQVIPCGIALFSEILVWVQSFQQQSQEYVNSYGSHYDYEGLFVPSFFLGMDLFWWVTRIVQQEIWQNYSWRLSIFFLLSWCALLPTACIGYGVYVVLTANLYNFQWAHQLVIQVGVPTIFLLCLTWVYYHYKFIVPFAAKKIDSPIKVQLQAAPQEGELPPEAINEQFVQPEENSQHSEEEEDKPSIPLKVRIYIAVKSFLNRISGKLIILSSFLLGGFLIFMEIFLLAYMAESTKTSYVASVPSFYIALFLFFFLPTFILAGIPLIVSSRNHDNKMLLIPIFLIFIGLFITMPLSRTVYNRSLDTEPVSSFFIYTPTIAVLFWLTIYFIGLRKKKTKMGIIPVVFIFFMFPIMILQPIISNSGFAYDQVAEGFEILFLVLGGLIVAIAIAYLISRALLIQQASANDRLNTDNYRLIAIFKADLEPFGYWINAFGYIICYTVSLYTLFWPPSGYSSGLEGITLGIALSLSVFFVYNNLALRLDVSPEAKRRRDRLITLSEAINNAAHLDDENEEVQRMKKRDRWIKMGVRIASAVIIFVTAIVAIAYSPTKNYNHKNIFATFCIGTIVCHLLFESYIIVKNKYGTIAKSVIAFFITYMWFVQLLLLACILQFAKVFYSISSSDSGKLKRIEVLLGVLVFILTVCLLAIIANIIFKGIELGQKIRYILAYLKRKLEEIAVKSDFYVLEKIFDGWMSDGEKKLKKSLINRGKPVFWWPIPDTNPIEKYSKVLIDFDAYKNLKMKAKRKKDGKPEKPDKPLKKAICPPLCCLALCAYCFPRKQKEPEVDQELEEEIEEMANINLDNIPIIPKEEGEDSDSEDEVDLGMELGEYEVETRIAQNKRMISELKFEPLHPFIIRAMAYYDKGIKFSYHDKEMVDFLKLVFRTFAVGSYKYFKKRWLDYLGYKQMLIFSATIPSPEFPDYMVDLTYTLYTHNVGRGEIQRRVNYSKKKNTSSKKNKEIKSKIEEERDDKAKLKVFPIFEEDFEGFLTHVAKVVFPNEVSDKEALHRYIRWHLWPNFNHLLPPFQKQYAHEHDYLLYLKEIYMGKSKKDGPKEISDGMDETIERKKDGKEWDNSRHKDGRHKKGQDGDEESGKGSLSLDGTGSGTDSKKLIKGNKMSCCQRLMIELCRLLGLCWASLLKLLLEFLMAVLFLKTNKQKKAEEEFDDQLRQDELDEREQVRKKRLDKYNQENLGDDPDLQDEELNKKGQFRRKAKTYPHKPSPDWPVIAETIVQSLKEAENDYENRKAADRQHFFIPNIRNYMTLFAIFFEIYAMACMAFRHEVPWGWPYDMNTVLAFPAGFYAGIQSRFWSAFGWSFFYGYISFISIYFAKESVLGWDKNTGKAGEFPSRGLAHSQTLIWTSCCVSVWVIKIFLDCYSCDYRVEPWFLYADETIVCFSEYHQFYMGLAALCMTIYYPLSSFLWPNLQYLNKGNDFKHDPSFIVLQKQGTLVLITLHVFFPFDEEIVIPLAYGVIFFTALALLCNYLKPNIVIGVNLWETGAYFMGAWINISAIVAYYSRNVGLSSFVLLLGLIGIFWITYFVYKHRNVGNSSIPGKNNNNELNEETDNNQDQKERAELEKKKEQYGEMVTERILSEGQDLTDRKGEDKPIAFPKEELDDLDEKK